MTSTVNDVEAKERLAALLDEVESGGAVVITRGDKPIARLVRVQPPFDREKARLAAEGLLAASEGVSLGGLTIRELIDEGRQ